MPTHLESPLNVILPAVAGSSTRQLALRTEHSCKRTWLHTTANARGCPQLQTHMAAHNCKRTCACPQLQTRVAAHNCKHAWLHTTANTRGCTQLQTCVAAHNCIRTWLHTTANKHGCTQLQAHVAAGILLEVITSSTHLMLWNN